MMGAKQSADMTASWPKTIQNLMAVSDVERDLVRAGCILQVSSQEEAKVDDGFVAEYNPEYDDGHPDVKSKLAELADAPISPVPSSFWGKIHLPFGYTLANVRVHDVSS